MTTKEYIEKLKERLAVLESGEHVFIAVSSIHADVSQRIFEGGLASDNSEIGTYNKSNSLYVNTKLNAPRSLKPTGKKGESVFKNGKSHKTTYFDSYSDFRKKQGRESEKVNLALNNFLKLDFTNSLTRSGNNSFVVKLKQKINYDKAKGNENRFNKKIFALSKEEKVNLYKEVQFESIRIMRGL